MWQDDFNSTGRPWGVWRELGQLQRDLNRLFADEPRSAAWPPVNVWHNQETALLKAELPGFAANELDISVLGDSVTLSGRREAQGAKDGTTVHRRERPYGSFTRTLQLPFRIDKERVKAQLQNGVLHLELPRALADMPRRINVKPN